MKKTGAVILALALLLAGCGQKEEGAGGSTTRAAVNSNVLQFTPAQAGALVAVIDTSEGEIKAVLYPRLAPAAVENFTALAAEGYYDGTAVHRVVKDMLIQGGDATGTGLSGKSIWGHPFATERSAELRHYAGALCMAAADEGPDTLLSQFYIVAAPPGNLAEEDLQALAEAGLPEAAVEAYRQAGGLPQLDYTDTVFGQVIAGMDVVDAIAAAGADEQGAPKTPITVKSITIISWPGSGAASAGAAVPGEAGSE